MGRRLPTPRHRRLRFAAGTDPPESNPSTRYSLHYDGRAIDVTTWPVNWNLYGRLCALAHCAGFDYVENEVTHCHASINASSLCTQCGE
ncbi:MAG: hypothetical protein KDJ97_27360 [Anaerolineae bacterium]|nr:hypothetical protein [Anaerolineae bacterium]